MSGWGEGGWGEGPYGGIPGMGYYLDLFTSQYQNSPKLKAFAQALLQPFTDIATCAQSFVAAFSLPTAVGVQLDTLGQIIGVSRQLPFQPVGVSALTTSSVAVGVHSVPVNNTTYMTVGGPVVVTGSDSHTETVSIISIVAGVSFTANFTLSHVTNSSVTGEAPSALLSDTDYRILLQAKVAQNQWNGQSGSLWSIWQQLYPGGTIYITDNQNMTATIILAGSFNPIQQQMITNGLIVPRPEAVQYTFTFATLPIFGFDGVNAAYIGGFDSGHWA